MACDYENIVHFPPIEVLNTLQQVSHDLKLGNSLRSCRHPDFLLEIMNREGAQQSLPWLTDIIRREMGTLSVLPTSVLCELLLVCINKSKSKILLFLLN